VQYKLADFEVLRSKKADQKITELQHIGFVASGRDELRPVPFTLPFHWNQDPHKDRNWMFQLHAWRMLDPYFERIHDARPGAEPETLHYIYEVLADWYTANIHKRPGEYTWFDMSVGIRALKLALLAFLNKQYKYDQNQAALLDNLVDIHIHELMDPGKLSSGNHGLFQLHGLKALSFFYPDHPRSELARNYAVENMTKLIDSQLGEHGVHTEGSPEYHFFAFRKIKRIVKAQWWEEIAAGVVNDKLEKAEIASNWLVDPLERCVPIGDSSQKKMPRVSHSIFEWPHDQGIRSIGAILDGYAVVRSDPALATDESFMLFMTASFYSQTHKHSDCLSFIWQEGGKNLLIDSGKYGYQKSKMREYFLSTRSHNTLEINGCSDSRAAACAYGTGISYVRLLSGSWLIGASSEKTIDGTPAGRQKYRHDRVVLFRPGKFVCVFDKLIPLRSSVWSLFRNKQDLVTSWWHFAPEFKLLSPTGKDNLLLSNDEIGKKLLVKHLNNCKGNKLNVSSGVTRPRLQGWESETYLQAHPAPAIGFESRGVKDYRSVTLFELLAIDSSPTLDLEVADGKMGFLLRDLCSSAALRDLDVCGDTSFIVSDSLL